MENQKTYNHRMTLRIPPDLREAIEDYMSTLRVKTDFTKTIQRLIWIGLDSENNDVE